jgi:predicted RNA-binding Zn-ribbon protein involved in translation (DUF1610 family)
MKCNYCGTEMILIDRFQSGGATYEVYQCPKCGSETQK